MSEIQRYRVGPDYLVPAYEDGGGKWVTYADHVAAVAAVEQEAGEQSHAHYMDGYAAALDAARDAVAALSFDSLSRDQGPVATQRQALAAIADLKEQTCITPNQ